MIRMIPKMFRILVTAAEEKKVILRLVIFDPFGTPAIGDAVATE